LSMSRFVQQIFAIKFRSCLNRTKFLTPNFFWRDDPNFSTANCYRDLHSTVWQSLVESCLLIAVCEAWQ